MVHIPVLLSEVVNFLLLAPGKHYIDATVGEGGHARVILEKTSPSGILLGVDRDGDQVRRAERNLSAFGTRAILRKGSFGNLETIARQVGKHVSWSGILFDLGWSLVQKERSGRGFTFQNDEPLDMRYDAGIEASEEGLKASSIVNTWPVKEIERILWEYSEERFAKPIAEAIGEIRKKQPLKSTFQLRDIIEKTTPAWYRHRRMPPATKTFQALRIAVNREFEELQKGLESASRLLSEGGRLLVISFHSGEDRVVKHIFKTLASEGKGALVMKKPIIASLKERQSNPRSRSAKLRVFLKFKSQNKPLSTAYAAPPTGGGRL